MLSSPYIRPNIFVSLLAAVGLVFYVGTTMNAVSDSEPLAQTTSNRTYPLGDSLIAFAKTLEGRPYRAGGCTESNGFDCSGLVKFTYDAFGLHVGRSSRDQALAGYSVPTGKARPGDIVVFARTSKERTRVFHSGLIVAAQQDSLIMIHANNRNGVHFTNITDSKYWKTKLHDIRRIERSPRP